MRLSKPDARKGFKGLYLSGPSGRLCLVDLPLQCRIGAISQPLPLKFVCIARSFDAYFRVSADGDFAPLVITSRNNPPPSVMG